jgi:hypothetical protein
MPSTRDRCRDKSAAGSRTVPDPGDERKTTAPPPSRLRRPGPLDAGPSGDERAFLEWFPYLAEIGRRCRGEIEIAVNRSGPMASGPAKVIDNAIIGFMRAHDAQPTSSTINPDDHHV